MKSEYKTPFVTSFYIFVVLGGLFFYFFIGSPPYKETLPRDVFNWPFMILFALFGVWAFMAWVFTKYENKFSTSGRIFTSIGCLLAAILISFLIFPVYEPYIFLVNSIAVTEETRTYAQVDVEGDTVAIHSPYWKRELAHFVPKNQAPPALKDGSLALVTLRRGIFFVHWVEEVSYEVLP